MSLIRHAHFPCLLLPNRALFSKTSLWKTLQQTRPGSYLRYSSLASIKMDAPTQDPSSDLLSSGFRGALISRRLCAFGRVATVIFIAILRRGCEDLRRAGNDIARKRKFLVDFSTIVRQLRTIDTRYTAQI